MPEIPIPGMIFPQAPPAPPQLPPLPPRAPMVELSDALPRRAPMKVLLAVVVTAISAAVLLPTAMIGIGIALTGAIVLGAVFVGSPTRPTPWQLLTAAGIVALLMVAGWRSAEWLAGWCVLLAVVATGALLIGGRSIREMAVTLIAPIMLSAGTFGWIGRAVVATYVGKPIKNPGAVIKVGGVTVLLVVVFGALFYSADATFASLLERITPDLDQPDFGWGLVFGLGVGVFTALGCYIRHARPRLAARPARVVGDTWTWAVPTGTVLVLYIAFLITQARAMFGDDEYVQRTAHLTYADYARSGFWQLFAVTALTILVVSIGWQRAGRDTLGSRILVRVILGGLCLAALAVVWSAIYRMNLYMAAYGATRLRVSVMAAELWFGAILVALIVGGLGLGTRQVPRVIGGLTMGAALAFAVYNPDAAIARANVDRFSDTATNAGSGKIDIAYLSGLSPDATEALLGLPDDVRRCVLNDIPATARAHHGWTEFNVGRSAAKDRLSGLDVALSGTGTDCSPR